MFNITTLRNSIMIRKVGWALTKLVLMSDLQICYTPRGLSTLNPSEKKTATSQQCSGADETQAGFRERTSDLPCPPMLVACSRAETHSC